MYTYLFIVSSLYVKILHSTWAPSLYVNVQKISLYSLYCQMCHYCQISYYPLQVKCSILIKQKERENAVLLLNNCSGISVLNKVTPLV